MPVTDRWAYFDHAAVAPLPQPAAETLAVYARQASEQGDTVWPTWAAELESLRSGVANWLRAESEEIALIPNTTFGINMIAEGLRWQEGDNVVIPGGEFPSNQFPWQNQQRRGVQLRIVPSPAGRVDLDGIRRAIDGRTRIVAASWVGYSSGYRLSIDDLCQLAHDRGSLVFIDAIQGLGPFPLDLSQTPVDFLAADGHKWMLGPEGAGLAFVRRKHLAQLDCPAIGWNSVRGSHNFSSESMDLRDAASRYEGGSQNMPGLMAMHASLKIFWQIAAAHPVDAIQNRILGLHSHAREGLLRRGVRIISDWSTANRSGILTFVPSRETPNELRTKLAKAGIAVSCRGGGVRIAMHAYNTTEEIDRLLEMV
jgi:selenocysteine lyase/cysteine desulfurase